MQAHEQQRYIVDIAFEREDMSLQSKGLKAYKFLVQYRFFEVLSNAFPVFYGLVSQKRFEKAVMAFMQSGAKSNQMWKVPNEFRKFVKKHDFFENMPYVHDLLWFEWKEVALMMQEYTLEQSKPFSWGNSYTLSRSAAVKKLSYPVFEADGYEKKGEYYLLAYYDFDAKKVFYRQIALPMYLFLKTLKKQNLQKALEEICQLSQEQLKDVKSFFQPSLEELLLLHVLQEKKELS